MSAALRFRAGAPSLQAWTAGNVGLRAWRSGQPHRRPERVVASAAASASTWAASASLGESVSLALSVTARWAGAASADALIAAAAGSSFSWRGSYSLAGPPSGDFDDAYTPEFGPVVARAWPLVVPAASAAGSGPGAG